MLKAENIARDFFVSPLGILEIRADNYGLISVLFTEDKSGPLPDHGHPGIKKAAKQLAEYFSGRREEFDLGLVLSGTGWQKKVWRAVASIPFGQTVSYSDLAKKLGGKKLARAVAAACAQNKLLLIIPCHRVIGQDGGLKGYAGGFRHKKWLLDFERSSAPEALD